MRKGFTIVEVIASLLVLSIVSVSSIAVVYTSTVLVDKSYDQYWAMREVNNLKECLINDRFKDDGALKFYFGKTGTYIQNNKTRDSLLDSTKADETDNGLNTYHFSYDNEYNIISNGSLGATYRISFFYNTKSDSFSVLAIRVDPVNKDKTQVIYRMDEEVTIGGGNGL